MSLSQQFSPADTWVLTDGRAGNVRQADALARAMGVAAHAPTLDARAPWRWFAPHRLPGAAHAFGPGFATGVGQPPRLAIGCGRQAALATRLLRERGARAVQILDPRVDPRHWDLVVAPEHDRLHGSNVLPVLGSLNPVDDAWLAEAAMRFPALMALPRPRMVLLVGGPTRHAPWRAAPVHALLETLRRQAREAGGSVLATVSRRTPPAVIDAMRRQSGADPGLLWDGSGANPYPGMLACADLIVCTADSVNMLSEACATRAPVYVAEAATARGRIADFLAALQSRRRIRPADGALAAFEAAPLRETARVAAQVRERLGA